MTTILSVAPFFGYGRHAHAACDPSPASPAFVCTGANVVTQTITADNADISTAPEFSVVTTTTDGIAVNGKGQLRFYDDNRSVITTTTGSSGLIIKIDGDLPDVKGGARVVTNGTIKGEFVGIGVRGKGTGSIEITADGDVSSRSNVGIYAWAETGGGDITITTGADSAISGRSTGILGMNEGVGDLEITAQGDVTATTNGAAIHGYNAYLAGDMTITTGAGSYLKGQTGILVRDNGSGDIALDVGGRIAATSSGIDAESSRGKLEIVTRAGSAITGADYGVFARNAGTADLVVTVAGDVTASAGHAILARNISPASEDLAVTVAATSRVTGQSVGIIAGNAGTGVTEIAVEGIVEGTDGTGIHATATVRGGRLEITTGAGSRVTGGLDGIQAFHESANAIAITIDGEVRGTAGNGIYARNFGDGDAVIEVGATGRIEGRVAGIDAASTGGRVVIVNAGLITGSNWLAIDAKGPSAAISNSGVVSGRVDLTDGDDRFDNLAGGVFAARGSDFGGGSNDVVNNAGLVQAAHGIAEFENVYFENLEIFNNSGTLSLVDGLANDIFGMGPAANYVGKGGRLAVDAFLAPGAAGTSDKLVIFGTTSGSTTLVVNLTNPIGSAPNTDGIQVVSVDGSSGEEDFNIEGGVLNAGFFAWDLRRVQDGVTVIHELYTTGFGAGAYEFAAGITGAQDMWQQTTGTLLQRQADLRPVIAAQQVTPVADFVTPVEPTPVGRVTPGLWFKAVGGWLDRDGEADNTIVLDRKQIVFGGIAGFDFGAENLSAPGDALLFGLFGGYLTSKLDFDSTGTEWKYDGPTVGLYATYLNHAFYADAVVKADFLAIDIDADELAPDAEADTNAVNIGGQIDLGYKIGFGHVAFIEPQASLSVLHTEIDDIDDIFGGSVKFEDETSVRGRLGLRLGADYQHDGLLLTPDVTASVWQSFTGDNTVTVFAPLTPAGDVSDDPGETVGDVSLGLAVTAPQGWSGFLRGNYQFAEDYQAITGNAGVRYSW